MRENPHDFELSVCLSLLRFSYQICPLFSCNQLAELFVRRCFPGTY